jgi:murein DD-endopeptidase MepM/ murein hydrolase activator NlpD
MLMHPEDTLQAAVGEVHPVVPFNAAADKLFPFDFTIMNTDLSPEILADTPLFSAYIDRQLRHHACKYGIGGYNEHRTLYVRSHHFDTEDEPRRLHLGTDIWGPSGTPVYAPISGYIHSFHFNDHFGDYGATLILKHTFPTLDFHTLYGHLSLSSISSIQVEDRVVKGQQIGSFGDPAENGHWPPHLHFQIIRDMQGMEGDYPGVCKFSHRQQYLENCPDPDVLLQMNRFIDV